MTVKKLNLEGEETWSYPGRVLERTNSSVRLEARFNRPDLPFYGLLLGQNDRFVEEFFSDRWYNIFEIHDRETDRLKGWYCNITYPAKIQEKSVSYADLALDLLIFPDGSQLILDMDEFEKLPLSSADRSQALEALHDLQRYFTEKLSQSLKGVPNPNPASNDRRYTTAEQKDTCNNKNDN